VQVDWQGSAAPRAWAASVTIRDVERGRPCRPFRRRLAVPATRRSS
jgi:hypothetical protein